MRSDQIFVRMRQAACRRQRGSLLLLLLVAAILLAACGGRGDTAAGAPAGSQDSQPAASGGTLPGTEEFGLTKQGLVESIDKVESLIAQCMNEAGFEYIAVDYDTVRKGMTADKSLPGIGDEQYVAQYGYGISTLYTGSAPQLGSVGTPATIGLGEENIRIFNSLPPADQAAYNHTMFGEYNDATFAVSLELEDFSRTGGCTRKAIEQVFTQEQISVTYLNPKDALVEQDKRVIEALVEWSDCMREAGYDYTNPNEVEPDIKARLDSITHGEAVEALTADDQAALAELQGEERAIATAEFSCTEEIVEPVVQQVETEIFGAPK